MIINPIIERVLRTVLDNVSWMQNTGKEQPDQFIVWTEEDTRPSLVGNNHPLIVSHWIQISLYTRCGLSKVIDPTIKTTELVDALTKAKFKITGYPLTTMDPAGYYHTVMRVRYDA